MPSSAGETDDQFDRSVAFASEMRLAAMHVFPYSPRTGTTATHLPDHVPPPVIRDRMQRMLNVAAEARRSYLERFAGRVMPVLWEERDGPDTDPLLNGLTDNYIRVRARDSRDLRNTITPARLLTINSGGYDGHAL
jgi:threonylcarbamoyladenosine tRNA methylthiotransferase MtaB